MDIKKDLTAEEAQAIKTYEQEISSSQFFKNTAKYKIDGILNPYETEETTVHPLSTLIKYLQLSFGLEFLIIIFAPVIVATIFRFTIQCFESQCPKKSYQDDHRRSIFYEQHPLLPLYYLQQTALEATVKRESRQTLSWYSKTWVMKTNELIDEVGGYFPYNSFRHDPDQKLFVLKQNRWRLVKILMHARGLCRQHMTEFSKDKTHQRDLKVQPKGKRRRPIIVKLKHTKSTLGQLNDEPKTQKYHTSGDRINKIKSIQSVDSVDIWSAPENK